MRYGRELPHRAACVAAALLSALAGACGDDAGAGGSGAQGGSGGSGGQGGGEPVSCTVRLAAGPDDQTTVQTALIEAEPGSTICFEAGTFLFTTELSLDVDHVTLAGAAEDQTILDFTGQDTGGNGMLIKSDGATLQDLTIRNTPGDGVRADSVAGVSFLRMTVLWDADASTDNGAYGLYPVGSTDVVIDGCTVKGARDAGIYVGQSERILVVNCQAYGNVAGIEIENSTDAVVRDNHAHDNTGGILVFNLPGLPVKDGKRANVYNNVIENNNGDNFGVAGTTVSKVPPGLGMLVLASDDNEIHDNQIRNNRSAGVVLLSYIEDLFGVADDPDYDHYPQGNFVHDNTWEGNGADPAPLIGTLTAIRPIPDVLWDGCLDAAAVDDGHLVNCLSEPGGTYLNINYCGDFPAQSQDVTPVACAYDPLPTD
jgi:parallel beta-helix repeat protein